MCVLEEIIALILSEWKLQDPNVQKRSMVVGNGEECVEVWPMKSHFTQGRHVHATASQISMDFTFHVPLLIYLFLFVCGCSILA